jgi:hypothetical protein
MDLLLRDCAAVDSAPPQKILNLFANGAAASIIPPLFEQVK